MLVLCQDFYSVLDDSHTLKRGMQVLLDQRAAQKGVQMFRPQSMNKKE